MKKSVESFIEEYERENAVAYSNVGGDYRDDLTYADGTQPMQQCVRPASVSKPYVFTITNTSGATANAVLFGSFTNLGAVNFGSAAGVTVLLGGSAARYSQLLYQLMSNPIQAGIWRFVSTTAIQLQQEISILYSNANGKYYGDPVPLGIYSNTFQNDATTIDIEYDVKVDGNTQVTIPIIAAATLTVIVFPNFIGDITDVMQGGSGIKEFERPILSGMVNVTKVVPSVNNKYPVVAGMPSAQKYIPGQTRG